MELVIRPLLSAVTEQQRTAEAGYRRSRLRYSPNVALESHSPLVRCREGYSH